jgi:protein subunit release factor A
LENKGENMSNIVIEIRAAEGGDDAKMLVEDHAATYIKAAGREYL